MCCNVICVEVGVRVWVCVGACVCFRFGMCVCLVRIHTLINMKVCTFGWAELVRRYIDSVFAKNVGFGRPFGWIRRKLVPSWLPTWRRSCTLKQKYEILLSITKSIFSLRLMSGWPVLRCRQLWQETHKLLSTWHMKTCKRYMGGLNNSGRGLPYVINNSHIFLKPLQILKIHMAIQNRSSPQTVL